MIYSNTNELNYGIEVQKFLDQKSSDYDLYLYNIHQIFPYSSKLFNLKKYLSVHTVTNYSDGPMKYVGFDGDVLIGIPFMINYGTMYYNQALLEKYKLPVPATWKEFNNTLSYVYSREHSKDSEFIGYMGNFSDSYAIVDTIHEILYSYRDNKYDEVPNYISNDSKEAISLMRHIIRNYSKEEYFRMSRDQMIEKIKTGKVLFAQTSNFPVSDADSKIMKFMNIPGKYDGFSSSRISGYNVGISKFLSSERQKSVSLILDVLLSESFQTYLVEDLNMFSGFRSLYKTEFSGSKRDKDKRKLNICNKIDCYMIYDLQFYNKPPNYYTNYEEYSTEFNRLVNTYFFDPTSDMTTEEMLTKVDDLTRNYYIKYSDGLGIATLTLLGIVYLIMIGSYILMFNRKYNVLFIFMNNNYWGVYLFGTFLSLYYAMASLGEINQNKCNFRFITLSLGIPFSLTPIFLRLIVLYPQSNKISSHVNRNFCNYLCAHIIFELFICTAYLLEPSDVTNHLMNISEGKDNFRTCDSKSFYNIIILVIDLAQKGIEVIGCAILIFAEWNIKATKSDMLGFAIAIIVDLIAFSVFAVFYFIPFNSRESYFILKTGPVLLFGLSNFIFVYMWKFTLMFTSAKEELEDKETYLNNKTNANTMRNITRMSLVNSDGRMNGSNNNNNSDGIFNNIIKCHYETAGVSGDNAKVGNPLNNANP